MQTGQTVTQRYRLTERLGVGPFAEVYLARDLAKGDRVAIKILATGARPDPELVKLVWWDARMAAASAAGAVVRVHEVGLTEDGRVFVASEHVEGGSLAALIRDVGPLEIGRALRLAIQISEALAAAARVGVVHNALTPENVVVTGRDERVKLTDFGLARLRSAAGPPVDPEGNSELPIDAEGSSELYDAPERRGGAGDDRSDVYALGAILYAMLAGTAPTASLSSPGPTDRPTPLRQVRPDVAPALEQLIAQAMDPDPARRQSSMDECLADLRDVVAGLAVGRSEGVQADRLVVETGAPRYRQALTRAANLASAWGNASVLFGGQSARRWAPRAIEWSSRPETRPAVIAVLALVAVGTVMWSIAQWHSRSPRETSPTIASTAVVEARPGAEARAGQAPASDVQRRPADLPARPDREDRRQGRATTPVDQEQRRQREVQLEADAQTGAQARAERPQQAELEAALRAQGARRPQGDDEAAVREELQQRRRLAEAMARAEEQQWRPQPEVSGRAEDPQRRRQADAEAAARAEEQRRRQAEGGPARAEEQRRRQEEATAAAAARAEERRQQAEAEAAARAEEQRRRQVEADAARRVSEERRRQEEQPRQAEAPKLVAARPPDAAPARPERPALSPVDVTRIRSQAERSLSERGLFRVSSADRWGVAVDISAFGEVALSGALRDTAMLGDAVRLVREVPGVTGVKTDVRVSDAGPTSVAQSESARLRADIERTLRGRGLLRESEADRWGVSVQVGQGGDVSLVGTVRDAGMQSEALRLVQAIPGVRQVKSDIQIGQRAGGS